MDVSPISCQGYKDKWDIKQIHQIVILPATNVGSSVVITIVVASVDVIPATANVVVVDSFHHFNCCHHGFCCYWALTYSKYQCEI